MKSHSFRHYRQKYFSSRTFRSVSHRLSRLAFILIILYSVTAHTNQKPFVRVAPYFTPYIESVNRIWHQAPHNAFTDIVYFNQYWYCVFREANSHRSSDGFGHIRIIRSQDTKTWTPIASFTDRKFDLRDPKITITPDQRLMVNFTGVKYVDTLKDNALNMYDESRVSFSKDGQNWSRPVNMNINNQAAWRITWHNGIAYTVSWHKRTGVALYKSRDGIHFRRITRLGIKGFPNETTLLFLPDDRMMAMVRREEKNKRVWVGQSLPPYTAWHFRDAPFFAGGPDMIMLPDTAVIASFRHYENGHGKILIASISRDLKIKELLRLPCGGDDGYAGMIWKDDALWVSYYSSHEGQASIYLAKLKFPSLHL